MAITTIEYVFDGGTETMLLCDAIEDWRHALHEMKQPVGRLWTPRMLRDLKAAGVTKEEAAVIAHAKLYANSKTVTISKGGDLAGNSSRDPAAVVAPVFPIFPASVASGGRSDSDSGGDQGSLFRSNQRKTARASRGRRR